MQFQGGLQLQRRYLPILLWVFSIWRQRRLQGQTLDLPRKSRGLPPLRPRHLRSMILVPKSCWRMCLLYRRNYWRCKRRNLEAAPRLSQENCFKCSQNWKNRREAATLPPSCCRTDDRKYYLFAGFCVSNCGLLENCQLNLCFVDICASIDMAGFGFTSPRNSLETSCPSTFK